MNNDFDLVAGLVQDYFDGLYRVDAGQLRGLFHPDAWLKAPGLRRSLDEWLAAVATRPIPQALGEAYRFRILSVEVIQDQAMVKAECPLFEHFYVDFLGLLKENGRWLIVNKMYTDTAC